MNYMFVCMCTHTCVCVSMCHYMCVVLVCLCVQLCLCVCVCMSVSACVCTCLWMRLRVTVQKENLKTTCKNWFSSTSCGSLGKKTKGPFSHFKVPGNFERIWADDWWSWIYNCYRTTLDTLLNVLRRTVETVSVYQRNKKKSSYRHHQSLNIFLNQHQCGWWKDSIWVVRIKSRTSLNSSDSRTQNWIHNWLKYK